MAKSPLSKGSTNINITRHRANVTPLALTIPVKEARNRKNHNLDVSHLTYRSCNKNNELIKVRAQYIRRFAKQASNYVATGKSAQSTKAIYEQFRAYIFFCDSQGVDPFSRTGYLKYFGNDGELRHQIKTYSPSLRLWQRNDGDELGLKESSCVFIQSAVTTALTWCAAYDENWKHQHRPFDKRKDSYKPYSEDEENVIISRLRDLFFGLAPQLIAIKKENTETPDELPVSINFGPFTEMLQIPTSLQSAQGQVSKSCAFNLAMGAAYHLFCYFTSLNDGPVREVCHPLVVEIDSRDKSLRTIKVRGFKARANKDVSATLTNEVDDQITFDVEKRSGVAFIELLSELSSLYGSNHELLYMLNSSNQISSHFNVTEVNKHLVAQLNLIASHRSLNLPWFREHFYTFLQGNAITLKKTINNIGRSIVSKTLYQLDKKSTTKSILDISYCILSCFTDIPLKGALLPLTYSEKDHNGNIRVSFSYQDGKKGFFEVPAHELSLVEDIERWALERAESACKTHPKLLLRYGCLKKQPKQWKGVSPTSANVMKRWGVKANDYFLTLQSSRFRETTSYQEYSEGHLTHLTELLQNTLATLNTHYVNGHSGSNKKILSQAIQVLERIAAGRTYDQAKQDTRTKLGIGMLSYDDWLKNKRPTNPNGVICSGLQDLKEGKNTQRATNKAIGRDLLCSEFDICYACKSARAVDEPNAIYKLISFIDVLKEALDHHPDAKPEVQAKVAAFEYTLEGASPDVLKEAWKRFNKKGRHPRVTINHALLSIYR
ncbi:hypothetical protein ACJO1H_05575 [Vibrio parahaemolyticus]|uniref:hypothetical protein n=1 Tax=Vibrio parahaemolyticus TaxID=670 RepID=UPI00387B4755